MSRDEIYYGLERIAARLSISKRRAREWCQSGVIRCYRGKKRNSPAWYCIESELAEDIKKIPEKL